MCRGKAEFTATEWLKLMFGQGEYREMAEELGKNPEWVFLDSEYDKNGVSKVYLCPMCHGSGSVIGGW